jgi:hypothetical protein
MFKISGEAGLRAEPQASGQQAEHKNLSFQSGWSAAT